MSASPTRRLSGAAVLLCLTGSAQAQMPANVVRDLRPLVHIAPNGSPQDQIGVGVFDTGSSRLYIAPESNALWNVPVTETAALGRYFTPNGRVQTNFGTWQVGGMLGGLFQGPERLTPAALPAGPGAGATVMPPYRNASAHIFASATRLNATAPASSGNLAASFTYFGAVGGGNSLNNIGMAYVGADAAGVAGGQAAMSVIVDPTQAMVLPFAFGIRDNRVGEPRTAADPMTGTFSYVDLNGNGVHNAGGSLNNQDAASYIGNQRTSSLFFQSAGSLATPTSTQNFNPNFLFSLALTPEGGGAAFTRQQVIAGGQPAAATRTASPEVTLTAEQAAIFGVGTSGNAATATTYIADTGAPTTGGGLLGTEHLNGFGQVWDFNRRELLLFGPRMQGDRDLVSGGMLMTVDRNAQGLAHSAVRQFRDHGVPATLPSTDAAADPVSRAAPTPGVQGVGIYRTHMSASNAGYMDGASALGLNANHQIDGMTTGGDDLRNTRLEVRTDPNGSQREAVAFRNQVFFSVDNISNGALGGDGEAFGGGVRAQRLLSQAAGDVFQSVTGSPVGTTGTNTLRFNQDVMGLAGNRGPTQNAAGTFEDNLRDFDLQPERGMRNAARVLRNIDPIIRGPGDNRNPDGDLPGGSAARTDVLGSSYSTYFSLSPPAAGGNPGGATNADILVNAAAGAAAPSFAGTTQVWAGSALMGLLEGDDIDALAVSRATAGGQLLLGSDAVRPGLVNPASPFVIGSRFNPNQDERFDGIDFLGNDADLVIFSLARNSQIINVLGNIPGLGRFLSPADLFISDFDGTFCLYATAESLGLDPAQDNIDGLDTMMIPTPGTLVPLGLASLLGARRRRRPRTSVA